MSCIFTNSALSLQILKTFFSSPLKLQQNKLERLSALNFFCTVNDPINAIQRPLFNYVVSLLTEYYARSKNGQTL